MRTGVVGSLLVVMTLLTSCGDATRSSDESSTVSDAVPAPTTSPPPLSGRLRVTQNQTSCCYTEGQVSFLTVTGPGNSEVVHRRFEAFGSIFPVADVQLAPGSYEIESHQQPCDGNCELLDGATNRCTLRVDVAESASVFVTVAFTPGDQQCTMTETDTPLESPVPDEFALRQPYKQCGMDMSLEVPGGHSGLERDCLVDANKAGAEAELTAFESGANPEAPDYFVYRTNADRTIDVFLPNLDRPTDGPWRMYTCAGLVPSLARGFALKDCTDPVELRTALP